MRVPGLSEPIQELKLAEFLAHQHLTDAVAGKIAEFWDVTQHQVNVRGHLIRAMLLLDLKQTTTFGPRILAMVGQTGENTREKTSTRGTHHARGGRNHAVVCNPADLCGPVRVVDLGCTRRENILFSRSRAQREGRRDEPRRAQTLLA